MKKLVAIIFRNISDINPVVFGNPIALFKVASVPKPQMFTLRPKHIKRSVLIALMEVARETRCPRQVDSEMPVEIGTRRKSMGAHIGVFGLTVDL